MTVTLDKFGRILIPKSMRTALNLKPGTRLSLEYTKNSRRAYIEVPLAIEHTLVVDEYGIPTVHGNTDEIMRYDFVDAIRKDREERGASRSAE